MPKLSCLFLALITQETVGLRRRGNRTDLSTDRNECPAVTTQPNFDFDTFISKRWYIQEQMTVGALPDNATDCYTAQYTVKDEATFWGYTVTVDNRAKSDIDGSLVGGEICAVRADDADPAKLKVAPCFIPSIFAGPYWVLAHNEEEGYALISGGQPTEWTPDGCRTGTGTNNAGLWIFSREPNPTDGRVEKVRAIAQQQGFDLSVLNPVSHSDCGGIY